MLACIHKHTHRDTYTHTPSKQERFTSYRDKKLLPHNWQTYHIHKNVHKHTFTHTRARARARMHTCPQHINISLQKRQKKIYRTSTHTYELAHSVPANTHTHARTHIHIHTHRHTHAHTHIHDTSMMSHHSHVSMVIPNQYICIYGYARDTHAHAHDITLLMSSCLCQQNNITLTSS